MADHKRLHMSSRELRELTDSELEQAFKANGRRAWRSILVTLAVCFGLVGVASLLLRVFGAGVFFPIIALATILLFVGYGVLITVVHRRGRVRLEMARRRKRHEP
jgi:fatty acid desaturase